jgi:hypothetical protein
MGLFGKDPYNTWEIMGTRPIYSVVRFPRDFEGDKWRFFRRTRGDYGSETNLDYRTVPMGQRWQINGITLAPESPYSFRAFVDLCEIFPTATVEVCLVNYESSVEIPLSDFWIPGEYILNTFHKLKFPINIEELAIFDAWIRFPQTESLEPRLAALLKDAAFRMILHIEWAAKK